MTPAAPHLDTITPKAKFRRIHRKSFGSDAATVKKSLKLRNEHKRLLNSSLSNAESCDEEDNSPKRRRFSPNSHRFESGPSTSKHCDSHVEFSDEDADELLSTPHVRKVNKSGRRNSKGERVGCSKTQFSFADEQSASGPDTQNTKRSYYIVQNDGRPAEMFRTDLLDRLRKGTDINADSDDEDVPGSGLTRMLDRWRTEWSYGTQVPLHPDTTYTNEVRSSAVQFRNPSSPCMRQQRRALMKKFFSMPYGVFPREPLRLYESSRMDERWLELLNERKDEVHRLPLTMEAFLKTMNAFEIDCYKNIHKKLLEPLHSPCSRVDEYDEEAACDICRARESEPDDEMVFCDGCNLCVHMSCYGLQVLPPGEWLCMKCCYCFGRNPPCVLCPTIGGALKCTDKKNQWAHVVCALWIHECRFGDIEKREPITCIDEIQEERWTAKCCICDTRQGACIKCSVSTCKTFFHVTCALRSGLEMRIEQDTDDDKVHMISLCSKHRSAKNFEPDEAFRDLSQVTGSDEETEGQSISGPLAMLEQTCYNFVDYKDISRRLSLDILCVSDVFEYWKWRRLHNNGRPLIDNLQDEITIDEPEQVQLELPDYSEITACGIEGISKKKHGRPKKGAAVDVVEAPSSNSYGLKKMTKTVRSWVRLCNSLHKGHGLLALVLRKAKEERNLFRSCGDAAVMIAEHISRPVPISQRTFAYLNDSIERLYTKEVLEEGEARAEELGCFSDSPAPRDTPSASLSTHLSSDSTASSSFSSVLYHPSSSDSPHVAARSAGKRNGAATSTRSSLPDKISKSKRRSSINDFVKREDEEKKESSRSADVKPIDSATENSQHISSRLRSASPMSATVQLRSNTASKADHVSKDVNKNNRKHAHKRQGEKDVDYVPPEEVLAELTESNGDSDIRKRLRSSETKNTSTAQKPLKDFKNTSRNFTTGLRDITQDEDEFSKPRTLRSRSSLPVMFQASRSPEKKPLAPSKSAPLMARNHSKRRSDVGSQTSRTVFVH